MDDDIRRKVERFFANYPLVKYPRNQILIFQGENVEKTYFIVSGRVTQYDISYRGDEIVVHTFKPPAFFPMTIVFNPESSNYFYKAVTATDVRIAPISDIQTFLRKNPDVTYDLLQRVYIGVNSLLDRMIHLMSGTARSRLIFDLLTEFKRFGKAIGEDRYIEANETSIASRSGLSRETVSREMKHLKDKGLVKINSRRIYLTDLTALEAQLSKYPK